MQITQHPPCRCSTHGKIVSDQEVKSFPFFFKSLQISGETVGEVRPVADMHQRKAEMARQSDAFIALPGEPPTRASRAVTHPRSQRGGEHDAVRAATDSRILLLLLRELRVR